MTESVLLGGEEKAKRRDRPNGGICLPAGLDEAAEGDGAFCGYVGTFLIADDRVDEVLEAIEHALVGTLHGVQLPHHDAERVDIGFLVVVFFLQHFWCHIEWTPYEAFILCNAVRFHFGETEI